MVWLNYYESFKNKLDLLILVEGKYILINGYTNISQIIRPANNIGYFLFHNSA